MRSATSRLLWAGFKPFDKKRGRFAGGVAKGFSLIELLVVIAVTTVMTAMLVPALAKARDSARNAICKSNQRQLGLTIALYATEFKSRVPIAWGGYVDPTFYYAYQPVA